MAAVQEGPDDGRGLHRVALLDVHLDVLLLAVVMQVLHHLLDVVVLVAHVDERPQVTPGAVHLPPFALGRSPQEYRAMRDVS